MTRYALMLAMFGFGFVVSANTDHKTHETADATTEEVVAEEAAATEGEKAPS